MKSGLFCFVLFILYSSSIKSQQDHHCSEETVCGSCIAALLFSKKFGDVNCFDAACKSVCESINQLTNHGSTSNPDFEVISLYFNNGTSSCGTCFRLGKCHLSQCNSTEEKFKSSISSGLSQFKMTHSYEALYPNQAKINQVTEDTSMIRNQLRNVYTNLLKIFDSNKLILEKCLEIYKLIILHKLRRERSGLNLISTNILIAAHNLKNEAENLDSAQIIQSNLFKTVVVSKLKQKFSKYEELGKLKGGSNNKDSLESIKKWYVSLKKLLENMAEFLNLTSNFTTRIYKIYYSLNSCLYLIDEPAIKPEVLKASSSDPISSKLKFTKLVSKQETNRSDDIIKKINSDLSSFLFSNQKEEQAIKNNQASTASINLERIDEIQREIKAALRSDLLKSEGLIEIENEIIKLKS